MKKTFKGELNRGTIRKTEGQEKKLYTQMTPEELEKCYLVINNCANKYWKISKHLKEKSTVSWNLKDIIDTIRGGLFDIIEYNRVKDDIRLVISSYKTYDIEVDGQITKCIMNICLSVKYNKIVTLWYNDILDTHKTINMNRYNKDLEVVF